MWRVWLYLLRTAGDKCVSFSLKYILFGWISFSVQGWKITACHDRKDKYVQDILSHCGGVARSGYSRYICNYVSNITNTFPLRTVGLKIIPLLRDHSLKCSVPFNTPSGWLAIQRVARASSIPHHPHLPSALMIQRRLAAAAGQQHFILCVLIGNAPLFYQLAHPYLWLHIGERVL